MNHKYSTTGLIILIGIITTGIFINALTSGDIDTICNLDDNMLIRLGGTWQCIPKANVTPTNNYQLEVNGNVSADYYFGDGSQLTGITATTNITPNSIQCAAGQVLWNTSIDATGDLSGVCVTDSDTTYTAGTGLILTGTVFSVNDTYFSVYNETSRIDALNSSKVEDVYSLNTYINVAGTTTNVSLELNETILNTTIDARDNQTLNEINNPTGDKTFSMTTRNLEFDFTTGTMTLEALGAFTNELLHIHQHTGNPSAGSHLIHLEAEDSDITGINITTIAESINANNNITTSEYLKGKVLATGNITSPYRTCYNSNCSVYTCFNGTHLVTSNGGTGYGC